MPWFADFLTALSRYNRRSPHPLGRRALAALLSAALALGTISPAAALAGEVDSEAEGTAPPGAIEGGPGESEETALEEVAGSGAAGGSEESGEGASVESEPQQESEPPVVTPDVTESAGEASPEALASSPEPPAAAGAGPAYEPVSAPPPAAPVENQPLSAPSAAGSEPAAQRPPEAQTPPRAPATPAPVAPSQPEAPGQQQPPAVPAERHSSGGSLAGHHVHTVAPGECLWSIATALLPAGASNAKIAAEVRRLWKLNARRIGTGDPDLLLVGTRLVLG
jgi:hypothetical protein